MWIIFAAVGLFAPLITTPFIQSSSPKVKEFLLPFGASLIVTNVLVHLLPEALRAHPGAGWAAMTGFAACFLAASMLVTCPHDHRHCDNQAHDQKNSLVASFLLLGLSVHAFLDGVSLCALSRNSDIGAMFGLILHRGFDGVALLALAGANRFDLEKTRAIFNSIVATSVAGFIVAWIGAMNWLPVGVLMGFATGVLLYVVATDVIPATHRNNKPGTNALAWVAGAIAILGLTESFPH
ncbi:MAG: ZIP family metal transporter [Armatimonadetes bacterium]|nr:ZIP family metal transporter [Armatimonadota bacterium]